MSVVSLEDLQDLLERTIRARGATDAGARALAAQAVEAEAMGQPHVGVAHVFEYLHAMEAGRIDAAAEPAITKPAPALIHSNAGGGIPQTGYDLAFDDLVATARALGLAAFAQSNAYTCGALGTFVARLARAGLIGFAATNGPPLLAGSGSTKPVYCTNPMAFAAPQADGPPLLIDQSSSATAFASIRKAARSGEEIPAGWAVDSDGKPTTDPKAAMAGAMVAFGGARGANIALMVEVLAAGLTGANWSLDAPDFMSGDQSPGTGLFVLAIDPRTIDPDFPARMAVQMARLSGEYGVHLPGLAKGEARERARREGVDIDDELLDRLRDPT